jgi:predicted transcriptional regulator
VPAPRETKNMTLRLDENIADTVQTIAEVEGSTVSDVIRNAITEHVDRRKADPEFKKLLQRNMERDAELLKMLADG